MKRSCCYCTKTLHTGKRIPREHDVTCVSCFDKRRGIVPHDVVLVLQLSEVPFKSDGLPRLTLNEGKFPELFT